jgi:hypothetical protein
MLRKILHFLPPLGLLLGLAPAGGSAGEPAPPPPRALVLDGATLIDVSSFGNASADVPNAVVVLREGRIIAAGPRSAVRIPDGAEIVHVAGKYIVPGLNDAFSTQNNQAQANAHLYMGVTSIVGLDEPPGGRRGPLFAGAHPSPRIFRLEMLTGYDDTLTPPPQTLGELLDRGRPLSDAELIRQIDGLAQSGIKVLLFYYSMSPEQVRVAARHARELGLATIGELGRTTYREAVDAGVEAFVHTSRYTLDAVPPELRAEVARSPFGPPRIRFYQALVHLRPDDPALQRQAAVFASSQAGLIPTASLNYLDLPDHKNPWKEPIAAILDPKDIHLPADRETGRSPAPDPAANPADGFPAGVAEKMLEIDAQYRKAGAHFLAGSGSDAFGTLPGISLHTELELLVRIGLTPRQALAAATSNFGTLFGWPTVGQVKAGSDADLLVLDENPVQDIAHLKKIHLLIQNGQILDRNRLLNPAPAATP